MNRQVLTHRLDHVHAEVFLIQFIKAHCSRFRRFSVFRGSIVRYLFLFSIFSIALTGLISCVSLNETIVTPAKVPGASYVGNESCKTCHEEIFNSFRRGPHARVEIPIAGIPRNTGCESCHGAGSKHVDVGGGWGRHIVNQKKNPEACLECHIGVEAEFHMPERHPVLEGHMNCAQCHDPHGKDIFKPSGGLAMARHNQLCAECHREQARTFVYEHEALREGCTVCHQPHGSINAKMLVEADANLCLKCHAQVAGSRFASGEVFVGQQRHTDFLMQGACWTSGCHTAVHGSNVNPHLRY